MDYKKLIWAVIFWSGCAAHSGERHFYKQVYSASVKEQMPQVAAQFRGGAFPYYHWASPIVQDVDVPGHISNGVFIPRHKELVIIKPGEWAQSPAYPIEPKEESYEQPTRVITMDAADITNLPGGPSPSTNVKPAGKIGDSSERMVQAK
jgi:hypothetical protein